MAAAEDWLRFAQAHQLAREIEQSALFVGEIPVEPRERRILTVGVVVAVLRLTEFIAGDSFVILLNASLEPVAFRLGTRKRDVRWTCVFDTAALWPGSMNPATPRSFEHMSEFPLQAGSLAVLRGNLKPAA